MKKRGQIWISAVIYIGLGVIAITLLLGAGVPLVSKMKDRNTFIQTKDVLQTIDSTIYTVVSEGPGSQRLLQPIEIKDGSLSIPESPRMIRWNMETKAVLQQPGVILTEGNLKLRLNEDPLIKDLYSAEIYMNQYANDSIIIWINGDVDGVIDNLNGKFGLSIRNDGIDTGLTKVNIVVV